MLFLALIAIAWLSVAALCWAACAMAARGDGAESSPRAGRRSNVPGRKPDKPAAGRRKPAAADDGLVVWEGLPELPVRNAGLTAAQSVR